MLIFGSPPSRGAWIEIYVGLCRYCRRESPPSRGAWIEIIINLLFNSEINVAPLAGGVD